MRNDVTSTGLPEDVDQDGSAPFFVCERTGRQWTFLVIGLVAGSFGGMVLVWAITDFLVNDREPIIWTGSNLLGLFVGCVWLLFMLVPSAICFWCWFNRSNFHYRIDEQGILAEGKLRLWKDVRYIGGRIEGSGGYFVYNLRGWNFLDRWIPCYPPLDEAEIDEVLEKIAAFAAENELDLIVG